MASGREAASRSVGISSDGGRAEGWLAGLALLLALGHFFVKRLIWDHVWCPSHFLLL